MALSFPISPTPGQTYTYSGRTWVWTGSAWKVNDTGAINGIIIGNTTPAAGSFTTLSANNTVNLGNVANVKIQGGSSGQVLSTDGTGNLSWTTASGSSALNVSNDTSTATNLYPTFANAVSGNISTLFTGNARLLYKPSTGELQSTVIVATNGLVVNSGTVSTSYAIPSGSNAMSAGPIVVADGVTVTVPTGGRWVVV